MPVRCLSMPASRAIDVPPLAGHRIVGPIDVPALLHAIEPESELVEDAPHPRVRYRGRALDPFRTSRAEQPVAQHADGLGAEAAAPVLRTEKSDRKEEQSRPHRSTGLCVSPDFPDQPPTNLNGQVQVSLTQLA